MSKKDRPEAVRRRNQIRSLKERLVGGRRALYKLSAEVRAALTEQASALWSLEESIQDAYLNEPSRLDGFVYVMTNPSWPAHVKIGRAFNPKSRLANFNTSSPHRDYKMHCTVFFENAKHAEKLVHRRLSYWRSDSQEWFEVSPQQAENEVIQVLLYDV